MGHVVSKIKDVADDVGDGVKGAAEAVGHVVGSAAHDASTIASDADHAIVTVGNGVAAVVKHVPIVGGTISKGILGVTDLNHLGNKAMNWGEHAAFHPLTAIKSAMTTVSNPSKLIHVGTQLVHTTRRAAGDVANVASAAKLVAPELAPELDGVSAVANLVAHPTVSGVLNSALKYVPKGGKLEKAVKFAAKADKYYNKATKAAKVAQKMNTMRKMYSQKGATNSMGASGTFGDESEPGLSIPMPVAENLSDFIDGFPVIECEDSPYASKMLNGKRVIPLFGARKTPYNVTGKSFNASCTDFLDGEQLIVLPDPNDSSKVIPFFGAFVHPEYSSHFRTEKLVPNYYSLVEHLAHTYGSHMIHCFKGTQWLGSIHHNEHGAILGSFKPAL